MIAASAAAFAFQQPPSPQPFPGSGGAAPQKAVPAAPAGQRGSTAAPPSAPAPGGVPTDASLGIPGIIFPGAEFLSSFDLGRSQRCYLFGASAAFAEVLAYYKQGFKDGGRELFKAPPAQQWDLGKFQEQTMAFPPSVTVKDYLYGNGEGYLHVEGTRQKRFKTVIQIVPIPGK